MGLISSVYSTPFAQVLDMPLPMIVGLVSMAGRVVGFSSPFGQNKKEQPMTAEHFRSLIS